MINIVIISISIIIFILYLLDLKRIKFTTKHIVTIAMVSSIAFILSMIKIIQYPQGGSITLFSTAPIMLVSILYGRTVGVTSGLIYALISLLNGSYVIHPAQFLLDYILPCMALGLAGVFGKDKKINIVLGGLLATTLSMICYVLSGVIFFASSAPKNMNPLIYSFIYNLSSVGVDGILSIFLISIFPIGRFNNVLKL